MPRAVIRPRGQRKIASIGQGGYLSEVELCVLLSRNTLDLKEGSVGAGVALTTLMAKYAPFAVESVEIGVSISLRDLIHCAGRLETSSRPNWVHPPPLKLFQPTSTMQ